MTHEIDDNLNKVELDAADKNVHEPAQDIVRDECRASTTSTTTPIDLVAAQISDLIRQNMNMVHEIAQLQ